MGPRAAGPWEHPAGPRLRRRAGQEAARRPDPLDPGSDAPPDAGTNGDAQKGGWIEKKGVKRKKGEGRDGGIGRICCVSSLGKGGF